MTERLDEARKYIELYKTAINNSDTEERKYSVTKNIYTSKTIYDS